MIPRSPRFPVPPSIDDSLSNSDVIVRENSDLTLNCHARGSPAPNIKWRREDGRKISFNKTFAGLDIFSFNFSTCFIFYTCIYYDNLRIGGRKKEFTCQRIIRYIHELIVHVYIFDVYL